MKPTIETQMTMTSISPDLGGDQDQINPLASLEPALRAWLAPALLSLPAVYHVGTLDPAHRRGVSWDGPGLSVSLHPAAWARIGNCLGSCHRLERVGGDGVFVDAYALAELLEPPDPDPLALAITAYAQERCYWVLRDLYVVQSIDGAGEVSDYAYFAAAAARSASPAWRDLVPMVDEDGGHWATAPADASYYPRLLMLPGWPLPSAGLLERFAITPPITRVDLGFEMAFLSYLEDVVQGVDGVWWDEGLCPRASVYPQGVIFAPRLDRWLVDDGPWHTRTMEPPVPHQPPRWDRRSYGAISRVPRTRWLCHRQRQRDTVPYERGHMIGRGSPRP